MVYLCPGQNFNKSWWSRFLVELPEELKLAARLGVRQMSGLKRGNTTCLGWSSSGIPCIVGTERKRWFGLSILNNSISTLQNTCHQAQVKRSSSKVGPPEFLISGKPHKSHCKVVNVIYWGLIGECISIQQADSIFEINSITAKKSYSALINPTVSWLRLQPLPLMGPEGAPATPGPMGIHRGSFHQMEAKLSGGLLPVVRYRTIRCWSTERACQMGITSFESKQELRVYFFFVITWSSEVRQSRNWGPDWIG